MRPHGKASVSARYPRAFGICQRCQFQYNLDDLQWQWDWKGGPRLFNQRIKVCATCLDKPQENGRTIVLPPDPIPISYPLPEDFVDADNPLSPLGFNVGELAGTTATFYAQEGATNLLLWSQELATTPTWNANQSTVTGDVAIAPDGTTTASILVPNTNNNAVHACSQQPAQTVAAGATVCFSVHVKPAGYNFVLIRCGNNLETIDFQANFNVATGTINTALGSAAGGAALLTRGVQSLSNGWYRIWIAGSAPSVTSYKCTIYCYNAIGVPSFAGDGVSGIYLWGAQLERFNAYANTPGVYVPTTTAIATQVVPAYASGANIGTMVHNGGIPAAFRGPANKRAEQSASLIVSNGDSQNWVGKNWNADPSGVTLSLPSTVAAVKHTVASFTITAPNDNKFLAKASGGTGYQFQGSPDGNTWTTLFSGTTAGTVGESITQTSTAVTAYQYHRITIAGDGISSVFIAQAAFFVSDAAPNDI